MTKPKTRPPADDFEEGDKADGPGAGHNKTERHQALAALIEEHCDLQDEEDAAMRRYIHKIRKKKNAVKAKAKSDFDVPTEAFNARAYLRRVERSKDNDEVVLATQELFDALEVGHNLDLVAVAERVAKKKADAAAEEAAKQEKKNKAKVTEHEVA